MGLAQPVGTGRGTPARQWLDDTGTLWCPHRRKPWPAPIPPKSPAPRPCAGCSMSSLRPRRSCWSWWPGREPWWGGGGSDCGSSVSGSRRILTVQLPFEEDHVATKSNNAEMSFKSTADILCALHVVRRRPDCGFRVPNDPCKICIGKPGASKISAN